MKIKRVKPASEFQPITISMTFESKEELDAIKAMVLWDVSIPKLVNNDSNSQEHIIISSFLLEMQKQLVIGG